jgi:hypothetical protein
MDKRALSLPPATQAVYCQAAVKIFASACGGQDADDKELTACLDAFDKSLPLWMQSKHVEVQERATSVSSLLASLNLLHVEVVKPTGGAVEAEGGAAGEGGGAGAVGAGGGQTTDLFNLSMETSDAPTLPLTSSDAPTLLSLDPSDKFGTVVDANKVSSGWRANRAQKRTSGSGA